ncbi:MAG: S41 family peptidase [Spirochaetia bacterium]
MNNSKKQFRPILWAGITIFTFCTIIFFTVSPSLFAQDTAADTSTEEAIQLFEQVFRFVQNNYVDEIESEVLLEGALQGLFDSLDDPHSTYLTASDVQDLTDTTSGQFGGVGLYIDKPSEETQEARDIPAYVRVVAPIEATPAYRSGINAGDFITHIEGESTVEMNINEVVDTLRGEPGTEVTVTILRGRDLFFDVSIERAVIEVPTVRYDMIQNTIGYLRIIQFTPYTEARVLDALNFFQEQNYSSLIIDLRGNPGGLLTSVVNIADSFLSGGSIVSTRSRIDSQNNVYEAREMTRVEEDIPIAVLIDQGSASASEILAGALRDQGRATIIGQTSFGKGSVQQVRLIPNGGFRLTMSRYYTPSGVNIDHIGIEPDIEVTEPELDEEQLEDYGTIISENRIPEFVRNNDEITEAEITDFIDSLHAEGIDLTDRYLRRMIRNEMNRTNNDPPVYDLEFDITLQRAIEFIENQRQE